MGGSLCTRMRAWVIVVCRGRLVKLMGAILSGIFGGLKLLFFSLVTKERNWKIFLFECFLFLSFCISVSTIILFEIFRVASFGKFDFC